MLKSKFFAGCFVAALFLFTCLCSAQTISIVSGNGQIVCPDCPGAPGVYAPLVVQVSDNNNNPLGGASVTWTAQQQGYAPVISTLQTVAATGQSTYTFVPLAFFFGTSLLPATIVASLSNGSSVTFYESTAQPQEGGAPVTVALTTGNSPPSLKGAAGSTAPPISVTVFFGVFPVQIPLPNIQVRIVSGTTGPSVSCQTQPGQPTGTILTNANGLATCTPVFGGEIGSGMYNIVVGGNFLSFGLTPLTVTTGSPAILKYISGSPQKVNPGTLSFTPLVAEVTDLGGNPVSGAQVTWAVTAGSATLSATTTTSSSIAGSIGQVSVRVTPTVGPVTVVATLSGVKNQQVSFTVDVNLVITGITAASGATQQIKQGQPFPDPLAVLVNDNSLPIAGATVTYTVTSGSVTLSSASAVTNAQGQAQVTATAGSTSGPAVVTASVTSSTNQTYTATFNLDVLPPGPVISSISNAAGFQSQSVSPCSLAYITGAGFADQLQGVVLAFLEAQTIVNGVTVQFNAPNGPYYAPILDVANENGQESMGIQIPCELQSTTMPETVPMVVSADGVASAPFNVTVSAYSPGIFQSVDPNDGVTRAVLLRPDGSYVSITNAAVPGETIRMFVTGLGQTNPPLFSNELDPTTPGPNGTLLPEFPTVLANTTGNLAVGVNNGGVTIVDAFYAYGMVGVYEVDFIVPQNTATGNNAPFAIGVNLNGNWIFGNGSLIPIQ